jgi:toxin ParE1/3/4
MIDYCEAFDMFPQRGTSREDLRPRLRTIGFRRTATIAFSIAVEIVTIVGVFYGGQDFEAVLKDATDAPQSIRIAIPAAAMRCFA